MFKSCMLGGRTLSLCKTGVEDNLRQQRRRRMLE